MPPADNQLPPPDIPNAPLKAAGLLLVTLLAIVAFVLFVMQARGVFQPTQRLLLVAESAEGVAVGSTLTFSGFAIGRVVRIELGDDGKAHLHIEVPVADARWLRTSSVFTLERGVVGGASLRAFSGLLEDPPLPDGARRDVLSGDASAGIPQLVASIQQLVINLERLTAEQSTLSSTLENLQKFSGALNGRHGALNALLGSEKNARQVIEALERANALLTKADARLFGRDGLMDKAELSVGELAQLLGEARNALKKADAILGNVNEASSDLDMLRNEVEATLRRVTALTEQLNQKWPFARERELKLP
ncbi:MAG: mammalian cell entry protein [Betaproteobacteria bacterium HGW-Betaproteobacteria-7]|jgi:phospholipid/cholesterol/gamma-HCH transport system substrate-binding protein|nr:MAG: mammalian cell entry protein [Betaproteobacteria bacterium HGW-Betaproteobacteria-7]